MPCIAVHDGDKVVIHGLTRCPELNGVIATICGTQRGRVMVQLPTGGVKSVKLDNLRHPWGWCHECRRECKYDRVGERTTCTICGCDFVEVLQGYPAYREATSFYGTPAALTPDYFAPPVYVTGPAPPAAVPPSPTPTPLQPTPTTGTQPAEPAQPAAAPAGQAPAGPSAAEMIFERLFGGQMGFGFFADMEAPDMTPVSRGAARTAVDALERVTSGSAGCKQEAGDAEASPEPECGCAVCQDDFGEGEKLLKMPCGHLFHEDCLLPWLEGHNTCPTCRHELPSIHSERPQQQQQQQEEADRPAPQGREAGSPIRLVGGDFFFPSVRFAPYGQPVRFGFPARVARGARN